MQAVCQPVCRRENGRSGSPLVPEQGFALKQIDLVQSTNHTFSEPVRKQLSTQIGLSPEILEHMVGCATPALVASLMATAISAEGNAAIFEAARSKEANPHIAEELVQLTAATAGIKDLETAGDALLTHATGRRVAVLGDQVAAQTGLPSQATHVLTGMVAAVLFGVLKHHLLLEQAHESALPAMLRAQLSAVSGRISDTVAQAMGFADASEFQRSIASRLSAATSAVTAAPEVAAPRQPVAVSPRATAARSSSDIAPIEAGKAGRWAWLLFALLAIVLGGVFTWSRLHPAGGADEAKPAAAAASSRSVAATGLGGTTSVGAVTAASTVAASRPVAVAGPAVASQAVAGGSAAASTAAASVSVVPATASAPVGASAVAGSIPLVSALRSGEPHPLEHDTVPKAQLAFGASRAGVPMLEAVLKDETEKEKLLDALGRNAAAGRVHVDVRLDAHVASAGWLGHLDDLLAPMTVPGAALRIEGTRIELAGALAANASDWRSRLQRQLGPTYNIAVFNADEATTSATDAYLRAMAHIVETDRRCAAPDMAGVLNLQVIGFASSSGHVPASAKESLTEAAQLMKACADGGHPVRLTISAFSDNAGNADANLQLSQKRAQAVRDFLVSAGAPADQLTATGYGRAQPVASNLTPGGRFANRRIVFAADGR